MVTSVSRADGTMQATYNGHPLYAFQGDHAPGQTNGNGLTGFGARWSVISLTSRSPAATVAAPAAPAATPSATSGGGMGYGNGNGGGGW